jgi:hypothetical protein
MRRGDAVLFDDGAIAAVVERVTGGEAILRIVRTKPGGQRLGAEKGINLPDTVLPVTALTDQDDAHLPLSPSTPTWSRCRSCVPRPTSSTSWTACTPPAPPPTISRSS